MPEYWMLYRRTGHLHAVPLPEYGTDAMHALLNWGPPALACQHRTTATPAGTEAARTVWICPSLPTNHYTTPEFEAGSHWLTRDMSVPDKDAWRILPAQELFKKFREEACEDNPAASTGLPIRRFTAVAGVRAYRLSEWHKHYILGRYALLSLYVTGGGAVWRMGDSKETARHGDWLLEMPRTKGWMSFRTTAEIEREFDFKAPPPSTLMPADAHVQYVRWAACACPLNNLVGEKVVLFDSAEVYDKGLAELRATYGDSRVHGFKARWDGCRWLLDGQIKTLDPDVGARAYRATVQKLTEHLVRALYQIVRAEDAGEA